MPLNSSRVPTKIFSVLLFFLGACKELTENDVIGHYGFSSGRVHVKLEVMPDGRFEEQSFLDGRKYHDTTGTWQLLSEGQHIILYGFMKVVDCNGNLISQPAKQETTPVFETFPFDGIIFCMDGGANFYRVN